MNKKGIEKTLVVLLFVMVLVIFSFAQKDTERFDRLYNTATRIQQQKQVQTVQMPTSPAKTAHN